MRVSARHLLRLLLVCGFFAGQVPLWGADPPNILFIAVDDLRPELGCYGKDYIHSPRIDALAARGVLFERAYCQQAVCSPSRTSLLTGLRPDTTRVYDLETHFRSTVPDAVTLPQYFKNHGYTAVGMGKIFHGRLNDLDSWSRWEGKTGGELYARPENRPANRDARGTPTEMADVPDETYRDGAVARQAIRSLQEFHEQKKPFFLAVGFIKPHLPFAAPKTYWDLYDASRIPLPPHPDPILNAPSLAGSNWGELRKYVGIPADGPLTDEQARELRHGYAACVSYLDANVGRVLDELDRLQLTERTIIILWSDHGWKLGDHGMWCKHTNYELDAQSPLMIVAPGIARARGRTKALVEFVDIYPTLCDLAGLPVPNGLAGTSLVPLLREPELPGKAAAISQYPRGQLMGYALKTDSARYVAWVDRKTWQISSEEYYDHDRDPGESVNVAAESEYADRVREHRQLFTALIPRTRKP